MDPHISLVTLGVTDLDEAIRFYRDDLGFPLQDREPDSDVAFFTLDGTWLALYPRELLAEDATVPDDGGGFSDVTLAHNVATKAEVDAVLEEAAAAAVASRSPHRTSSGAAIRGTSPTPTTTSGKSRTHG